MSDWQKGDLALCVAEPIGAVPVGWEPMIGGVYTVAGFDWGGDPTGFLELEEDPERFAPDAGWEPLCFVKITPGADIEGIEEPRRLPVKERADA